MKKSTRIIAFLLFTVMALLPIGQNLVLAEGLSTEISPPKILNPVGEYGSITVSEKVIEISGTVEKDCTVCIYRWEGFGDKKIAEVETENKEFKVEIELNEGSNSITATAVIDGSESMKTGRVYITLDTKGPEITITYPSPYYTPYVEEDNIKITGTVKAESGVQKVTINDEEAQLTLSDDENVGYKFEKEISLDVGENIIKIIAIDKIGNKSTENIKIIRIAPENPEEPDPDPDEIVDIPSLVLKRVILAELGYLDGLDFYELGTPLDNELINKLTEENLLKLEQIYYEEGNHSDLYDHNVKITNFKGLEYATNLTSLMLSYCEDKEYTLEKNGGIKPLENHTKLVNVKLKNNKITDISPLANCKDMKHLNIALNRINDISILKNFTELETLDMEYNQITDISSLTNLTKLTKLSFRNNHVKNIKPLENLTNLKKHLWIDNNEIENIEPLQNLTQLEELELSSNQIKDITPLENLTNLKELRLNYNTNIENISPLTNLTKLENLGLRGLSNLKTIEDIKPLIKLSNLQSLILAETPFEGKEEDILLAIDIQKQIDELPEKNNVTLEDKENIEAIRKVYNNVTDEQKELIHGLVDDSKLSEVEAKIKELLDGTEKPIRIETITKTEEDNKIEITISAFSEKDIKGIVILKPIDENGRAYRVICKSEDFIIGENEIKIQLKTSKYPKGIKEVKVYIWDSLENMKPLADVKISA